MKLSQKLLYMFFSFFIVLFFCLVVFLHWVESEGVKKQLRRDYSLIVRDFAREGDRLINNNNQGNLYLVFKERLERTNTLPKLLYLRILDKDAQIYFSYKEQDEEFSPTKHERDKSMQMQTNAKNPFVASTLSSNLGDVYDISVRFENEKGEFLLRCGLLIGVQGNVDFNILFILFIFLGFLSIIFVFIVNSVIVKPLELLRDEASQIALGSGGEFILPKFRDDEIGDLARALDNLVHELKKKQKMLAEQERLAILGRGTGRLTHNISNLLNPLDNAFQQIHASLDAAKGDPAVGEALQTIEKHFLLVQHDLRRLRSAIPDSPQREVYPLSICVKTALSRTIFPENIELQEGSESEEMMVLLDPEQMTVVIYNLVTNAIQAMPEGGTLLIKASKRRDKAFVQIVDNGCGISKEQQESIFQFFQSTKKDGMGIGLASSLEIVRNHSGLIHVVSELGNGSTFTIELPLHNKSNE
jgi:signal transduction histidine kinase